jgi:hypothetical protein
MISWELYVVCGGKRLRSFATSLRFVSYGMFGVSSVDWRCIREHHRQ